MDEINKILERIESDLISDGYVDGNVLLQDVKKVRELAMNFTHCYTTLSDLDGKTILVKFKVIKHMPTIIIDDI